MANFEQFEQCLGLPPVPFSPGRPDFQLVCPASQWNVCRGAVCAVFLTYYPHRKYSNNSNILNVYFLHYDRLSVHKIVKKT